MKKVDYIDSFTQKRIKILIHIPLITILAFTILVVLYIFRQKQIVTVFILSSNEVNSCDSVNVKVNETTIYHESLCSSAIPIDYEKRTLFLSKERCKFNIDVNEIYSLERVFS